MGQRSFVFVLFLFSFVLFVVVVVVVFVESKFWIRFGANFANPRIVPKININEHNFTKYLFIVIEHLVR